MEITARNTNDLSMKLYAMLDQHCVTDQSRNGPVLRFDGPVTICLTHPWERVNFCPTRDANPFFHVVEAVAMLANWNSVKLMSYFAKNMAEFSDDGRTYNAFYGTRARSAFSLDQMRVVVDTLRKDPGSRQAVVSLWDPQDLVRNTKDKACNLCLIFAIRAGVLELTTFNRSNDAIWGGVSGANVVHLSFFHEYVACALGVPMGRWWHVSANLHVYTENPKLRPLVLKAQVGNYSSPAIVWRMELFPTGHHKEFDMAAIALCQIMEYCIRRDLSHEDTVKKVLDAMSHSPDEQAFIHRVVVPMFLAWHARKTKVGGTWMEDHLTAIQDDAWRFAAESWVARHTVQEVPHV